MGFNYRIGLPYLLILNMNISMVCLIPFMVIIALVIFEIMLGEMIRRRQVSSHFRNTRNGDMETFSNIDTNSDGALSMSELEAALGQHYSRVDINSIFTLADLNSDEMINFSEFVFPSLVKLRKKQDKTFLKILEMTNPWSLC